jgi:hypothetical protein
MDHGTPIIIHKADLTRGDFLTQAGLIQSSLPDVPVPESGTEIPTGVEQWN